MRAYAPRLAAARSAVEVYADKIGAGERADIGQEGVAFPAICCRRRTALASSAGVPVLVSTIVS